MYGMNYEMMLYEESDHVVGGAGWGCYDISHLNRCTESGYPCQTGAAREIFGSYLVCSESR